MLYSDFITEFKKLCPDSWSLWVETSLNVSLSNIEQVAEIFDIFVVDIKSMDEDIYKSYTGGSLSVAKNNLMKLFNIIGPERIITRVPLIPDYSSKNDQIRTVKELQELGITQIDAFTYKNR